MDGHCTLLKLRETNDHRCYGRPARRASCGIQVHVMRNAVMGRVERLTGIGRNSKRHLLAYLHFSHICFWNWHH